MNDSPEQATKQEAPELAEAKIVSKMLPVKTKTKATTKSVKAPATAGTKPTKPVIAAEIQVAPELPVAAKTGSAKSKAVIKSLKATPPTKAKVTKTVAKIVKPATDKVLAKGKSGNGAMDEKEKKHAGRKAKLIRDSFTFPEADYLRIGILKQRALKAGHDAKKSELLRAGLMLLSDLSEAALLQVLGGIVKLKPGRPIK